jgi:membrane-associated phospholipid phosphatase
VPRNKLAVTSLASLISFAVLAWVVADGRSPYPFEDRTLSWLGPPSAIGTWIDLIEVLALPSICIVLVVAGSFAHVKGILIRVAVYAAFGVAALLISEHMAKPLVHRTYDAVLTFPSGHVTAVCATALSMWFALSPVLGRWARRITFFLGIAWVILMSAAVVGAQWHTPLDCAGSVLLSVGVICAFAALFESTKEGRGSSTRRGSPSNHGGDDARLANPTTPIDSAHILAPASVAKHQET